MKKKATIKDIAQKTGYSVITVSKALRDHSDISNETKSQIKQAAAELGYIKNASATTLRTGSTFTFALIISDITNPFFGILARNIEKYAKERGYTVIVMNTDEIPEKEVDAVQTAISSNVDGVLIVPCQKGAASIALLETYNIPYVLIGRHFPEKSYCSVVIDDYMGGYLATSHLLEQGYSRILMLNAEPSLSSAAERLRGYRQAHFDRKLIPDEQLCIYGQSTTGLCEETLKECSMLHYDAIFAYNDILAFEAISVLQKNGTRIPEDLAVVGFDDITATIGYLYPLTSVTVPFDRLAFLSVSRLLSIIKNECHELLTVVDVSLHIRDTTPPKQQR